MGVKCWGWLPCGEGVSRWPVLTLSPSGLRGSPAVPPFEKVGNYFSINIRKFDSFSFFLGKKILRAIIYKKKNPNFYFLLQKSTFFFFSRFFHSCQNFQAFNWTKFFTFLKLGSFWQSGFFILHFSVKKSLSLIVIVIDKSRHKQTTDRA